MKKLNENYINEISKKVLVGMSGGVDSSVAALLLKQQGYEVIGATMNLYENKKNQQEGCCASSAAAEAKKVCDQLGIPHHTFNCEKDFKTYVIDNFINCYKNAQTPNPCVECNKYLKFGAFYQKALELNCDYIATGHYAKVEFSEKYNQYVLKMSDERSKDQSYFLYGISKEVLPKMLFPLENISSKDEVRKIAKENNLEVAEKKESQEICFIPDNDYGKFLEENMEKLPPKGDIVLKGTNEVLGKHKGLIFYTVGQRKGLGVAYKEPLYVIELNSSNNTVVVGIEKDLYTTTLNANNVNILIDLDLTKSIEIKAKIRYRSKPAEAILEINSECNQAIVTFKEPQRAVTKGQSVVFYIDEDIVLGGGIIV